MIGVRNREDHRLKPVPPVTSKIEPQVAQAVACEGLWVAQALACEGLWWHRL